MKKRRRLRAVRRVFVRETGETVEPGGAFEARLTTAELERLISRGAVAMDRGPAQPDNQEENNNAKGSTGGADD